MKVTIVFVVCFLAAVFAADDDHYTTKYDSIDIDEILGNKRLLQGYIKCLMDTAKCNEEGQTLKDVIPDALITACKKCSPTQQKSIEKVIRFLIKNNRKDWDALVAKYDPEGTYRKNYDKYYKDVME